MLKRFLEWLHKGESYCPECQVWIQDTVYNSCVVRRGSDGELFMHPEHILAEEFYTDKYGIRH